MHLMYIYLGFSVILGGLGLNLKIKQLFWHLDNIFAFVNSKFLDTYHSINVR